MRIICPTCASHYEVDAEKLGATDQLVRCAHCREVWLVRRTEQAATPGIAPESPLGTPSVDPSGHADRPSLPIDFKSAKSRLRSGSAIGFRPDRTGSIGLLSVAAICASAVGLLIGLRAAIVTELPAAAVAYAALGFPVAADDGLALRDVKSVLVAEGSQTVLRLEGEIANLRDGPTKVPNLTVVVRDNAQVPLYTWTTAAPKSMLGKGETVAFHSRLSAPPSDGRDVHVSFADHGAMIVAGR